MISSRSFYVHGHDCPSPAQPSPAQPRQDPASAARSPGSRCRWPTASTAIRRYRRSSSSSFPRMAVRSARSICTPTPSSSFTHIRDTAAQHGPMAWAVAVCIDLTCVMAARERQRDKQAGIPARRLSWPTVVLAGGVLLSLAANLAQAQPTAWGRIVGAVPPAVPAPTPARTRRCGRAVRAGTAVPAASCRGRGAGRRGRGAPRGGAAGRRRAPGPARPADHPGRAPRPARCVQPGRLRAAAPAPHGRGPAAGNLPRRLTPAASPHWPSLVRGGQVGGRGRGAGGGSTGTAKAWQPTGTGSPATGRPARGQRPARPVAAGPPAAGAEGLRPGARDRAPGRSAELADRLAGFANQSPRHTAS